MTTKTNEIKNIADGTECSSLLGFFGGKYELPASWARQDTNRGARLLIHAILPMDGIPMEGSSNESLRFQGEVDGLGYVMTYEVSDEDDMGFVVVSNVHVYRDSVWDRPEDEKCSDTFEVSETCDELFQDVPAVTFDTIEEYEQQYERCTNDGIRIAAKRIWEQAKGEVESYWRREETTRSRGALPIESTKMTKLKLEAYASAMDALGCYLKVTVDGLDSCKRIFEVSSNFGCVRSYSKDNWY